MAPNALWRQVHILRKRELTSFFGWGAVGEERADKIFDAGEDLVQSEGGGVDDDRIGGGVERGVGSIAVALVALAELLKNCGVGVIGAGWGTVSGTGVLLVA